MSFNYQPIPNIDSYQAPPLELNIPFNTDIEILACLEYKSIPDILVIKGRQLIYKDFHFCYCWKYKLITKDRPGLIVRIPRSVNCNKMLSSSKNEYIFSYRIYSTLHRPNFISQNSQYLYLGYEVPLDEYIDNTKLIEKGKNIIKGLLELF
jgi:hypothetical protein